MLWPSISIAEFSIVANANNEVHTVCYKSNLLSDCSRVVMMPLLLPLLSLLEGMHLRSQLLQGGVAAC